MKTPAFKSIEEIDLFIKAKKDIGDVFAAHAALLACRLERALRSRFGLEDGDGRIVVEAGRYAGDLQGNVAVEAKAELTPKERPPIHVGFQLLWEADHWEHQFNPGRKTAGTANLQDGAIPTEWVEALAAEFAERVATT